MVVGERDERVGLLDDGELVDGAGREPLDLAQQIGGLSGGCDSVPVAGWRSGRDEALPLEGSRGSMGRSFTR